MSEGLMRNPVPTAQYIPTTFGEIWKRLSAINVNDHTEERLGLTYLSWAWAWGVMMEHYPELIVEWAMTPGTDGIVRDAIYYPNGTASVQCRVNIGGCVRDMWLPVMDHKDKERRSAVNPDSRAISDAKMRCLTKCFALFGLGHYIYAGEDLPSKDDADALIALVRRTGKELADTGAEIDNALRESTKKAIRERDTHLLKDILNTLNTMKGD